MNDPYNQPEQLENGQLPDEFLERPRIVDEAVYEMTNNPTVIAGFQEAYQGETDVEEAA